MRWGGGKNRSRGKACACMAWHGCRTVASCVWARVAGESALPFSALVSATQRHGHCSQKRSPLVAETVTKSCGKVRPPSYMEY